MQDIIIQPENQLNQYDIDVYNYTKTYIHTQLPDIENIQKTAKSDNKNRALIIYSDSSNCAMKHVQYDNSTVATLLYDSGLLSKIIVSAYSLITPITEIPAEQLDT